MTNHGPGRVSLFSVARISWRAGSFVLGSIIGGLRVDWWAWCAVADGQLIVFNGS